MAKRRIRALIFDIDGVITDGKKYIDGLSHEMKSVAYKDLDAIRAFQKEDVLVGCITGEDTTFSRKLAQDLDFSSLGKKNKKDVIKEFSVDHQIDAADICYIGDGIYDVEVLKHIGLAVCPNDAIFEVKSIADIILDTCGGQGCIAELYSRFHWMNDSKLFQNKTGILNIIGTRINTHQKMVEQILKNEYLLKTINIVCQRIIELYKNNGQLFLCGNGGSAADAQHIAAELVGRFYLERQAYSAEALSTNTSIITALANDYDYSMIYARQIEAKGKKGDVLIGLTTSGKSENIHNAFKQAKAGGMWTVLMTGDIKTRLPIFEYTDYTINIPSEDTPRIQEGHILVGHIICEIIESELTEENGKNE